MADSKETMKPKGYQEDKQEILLLLAVQLRLARASYSECTKAIRMGRAGPHDLVLALAHLYVSKSPTGCLRPSARPEGSFAKLTKRV